MPAASRSRYTEVVRRTLSRPPPFLLAAADGGLNLENLSHGQLQVLSSVPAENAALAMAGDQETSPGLYVDLPPPIMAGRGVVKRFSNGKIHIVPMHADWFCPTKVHNLEMQLCPHFFCSNSADQITEKYMNFRNSIVAKYMENPEKLLSIDDYIDNEDSNRIFHFLENWGIINYCARAPDHVSWNVDSYLTEDENGAIHVPSAALNSIEGLIKFDMPKCNSSSSSSIGDDLSELENRIQEKLAEHRCKHCSQPLLVDYYQSVKGDVMLCLDCYHEGRFVIGHSSIDFSRVDCMKEDGGRDADTWTDQETVLLLEALEMYSDDWKEIADHVGSKSKAQCILHFLRLPVEDGLLSNFDVPHSNSNQHSESCIQDSDFCSKLPFLNFGNPVMALVAFLAESVGPKVAAACAQASLGALSECEGLFPLEETLAEDDGSHDGTRSCGQHGEVSPKYVQVVKSAVKAGLVAAAIKAKLLAEHEEREIQRQVAIITSVELRRLDLKLTQFTEVDNLLLKQSEQYEKTKQSLAAEMTSQFVPPLLANAPLQLMPVSSSYRPIGSGFGNQSNNMPSTFSFGPHLAFSTIQPSYSLQSCFGHPISRTMPGTSFGFS